MTNSKPSTPSERSDQRQQKAIGQMLARCLSDTTAEPAPDEFLTLLRMADQRHREPSEIKGGS